MNDLNGNFYNAINDTTKNLSTNHWKSTTKRISAFSKVDVHKKTPIIGAEKDLNRNTKERHFNCRRGSKQVFE